MRLAKVIGLLFSLKLRRWNRQWKLHAAFADRLTVILLVALGTGLLLE